MRRRLLAVVLLPFVASLLLVACSEDDEAGPRAPMAPMMDGDMRHGDRSHGDRWDSTPVADGARRIEVSATSFAFEPDEITVTAEEDVAIVLRSEDVLHDFTMDDIDVHVAADAGDTAEGGLRADEPGEYPFYCTLAGHRDAGMEGTLVVKEP